MLIDIEVPPGWAFHVYHRKKEVGFSVSLVRSGYAQKTIIIKGEGKTLEEALEGMVRERVRLAKEN